MQLRSDAASTIQRIVRNVDPITLRPIRIEFKLWCAPTFISYEAHTLMRYVVTSGKRADPSTRRLFERHELMRLARLSKFPFESTAVDIEERLRRHRHDLLCKDLFNGDHGTASRLVQLLGDIHEGSTSDEWMRVATRVNNSIFHIQESAILVQRGRQRVVLLPPRLPLRGAE